MSKNSYPADVKYVDDGGLQSTLPNPVNTKPWWKIGGKDYSFVSVDAGYPKTVDSASSSDTALNVSLDHNVYETDGVKDVYKPIEGYEGTHRFDPSFQWDPQEEKRLVRTVSVFSFHFYL